MSHSRTVALTAWHGKNPVATARGSDKKGLAHCDGLLASPNLLLDVNNSAKTWGECVVGDITCVPTRDGWAYLAMFQDKVTKRLVGWAISDSMTADLVIRALQMALRRGLLKRGCIVHTDRGSQYVSNDFRSLLKRCGLRQSMSGKGNCYDNAQRSF